MSDELSICTFALPLAGKSAPLADLHALLGDLRGVDVIALGEMNHFVHEKTDFRIWLLRALALHGIDAIGEELGWSDGMRVAEFLGGDSNALGRIATLGYTGDRRSDRDHLPTGLLREAIEQYPTALFRAEQERGYRALASSTLAGSRYFGFDVEADPGSAYVDIERALAPLRGSVSVRELLATLVRVPGESLAAERNRLDRTLRALSLCEPDLPVDLRATLRDRLVTLRESVTYFSVANPAPDYVALGSAMALREELMKHHVVRIRSASGDRGRLVLMGHALHLVKDDDALQATGGGGPGGGITHSLGHHLAQQLGLKVFVVWFMYGAGEDSQPFASLPRKHRYSDDTLNGRLAAESRRRGNCGLVLRTANPVCAGVLDIGHMYGATFRAAPAQQADLIVFLPRATPLRAA